MTTIISFRITKQLIVAAVEFAVKNQVNSDLAVLAVIGKLPLMMQLSASQAVLLGLLERGVK